MKKWLFWLLMTVVLFGLTACNSAPAVSDDSDNVTTTTASSATTTTTTTTATVQPMVRITYSTSENATLQGLQKSCDILEQRLTAMGMFGYRISLTEDETILLEVPRSYYPGNLNKRAYIWGSQGELAICVGDTEDGIVPLPPEDTVLDYRHVSSAEAVVLQSGEYAVTLTFTAEGADLLANITTELAKTQDYLYVHMDWEFWDALQVLQPITDGECMVTGFASWEAAALFAAKINAGLLPYNLSAGVDFSLVE